MPLDVSFAWFSHHLIEGTDLTAHFWAPTVQTHEVDVLVLAGPERLHIGHWIVDFLPQLRAYDAASGRKIVVPASAPKKFFELLALFDIPDDHILRCDLAKRYRFRSVLVVQHGKAVQPSPSDVQFLARALRLAKPTTAPRRRFYLDRDAPTRRIANRDDFDRMLADLGFETLSLAKMSIAEQREALGAAEIVLGIHGSEMLASLFMPAGTHLIELNYDSGGMAWWENAATCSFLGVRHHFFQCVAVEESGERIQKKDSDFAVETGRLRDLVATLATN
jgi:capsular polysaccharide biosynthesis protein